MIGTMSYNGPPSELFARSLRRRLQSLTPDRNAGSPPRTDAAAEKEPSELGETSGLLAALSGGDDKERVRRILERGLILGEKKKSNETETSQGSTFPPRGMLTAEILVAKFQSETEVFAIKNIQGSSDGSPEEIEAAFDNGDSDLFFDFDIGSPDQIEEIEDARIINLSIEDKDENQAEVISDGKLLVSSNSPTILETCTNESRPCHSDSTTEPSTAYGSTSSGLYCDSDSRGVIKESKNIEGVSLLPEDWVRNQTSGSLDVLTPDLANEERPPKIGDLPENISNVSSNLEINLSDKPVDSDSVMICIGSTEKSVAQSKLQALLAQLDKGGDFGVVSSTARRRSSKDSPDLGPCDADGSNFNNTLGRWQSNLEMTDFEKGKIKSSDVATKESYKANRGSLEDVQKGGGEKKEKYRRCSSLRSGKTPPGTPGRRKIVRFADVFGLEIADIKTFLDEVPNIPKSAYKDLKDAELSDMESETGSDLTFPVLPPTGPPSIPSYTATTSPTMAPLFNQPSSSSEFFNVLRDKKVCLESAYMSDASNIKGIVRVVNLDYNKKVFIKFTLDDWKTTALSLVSDLHTPSPDGISADYIEGSCDGFSDKFTFIINYSTIAGIIGRRLEFCIRFECANNDYWDNNFGKNYIFQCFGPSPSLAKSISVPVSSVPRPSLQTSLSHSPGGLNEDPWHLYL